MPGKLEDGLSPRLEEIRLYNKDDLVSTYKLNQWLLKLKSQLNIEESLLKQEDKKEKKEREIDTQASLLFDEIPSQKLQINENKNKVYPPNPRGWSWETQKVLASLFGFLVREQDVNYWRYFDRQEQSFVNPSSLLKDDEVIAEAHLIESSADIEYSFNPEQPIKLEKDANNWSLRLFLPKSGRKLVVQLMDLTVKRGLSNSKRVKIYGNYLAINECLIKEEEAYFTSSIKKIFLAQAKEWVIGDISISPTIIQLLERDVVPELIPVNEKINKDLPNINKYISDFILIMMKFYLQYRDLPGLVKQHYQVK